MEQLTMLEALRQIEETQPGGLLYQESQQVGGEWEVREVAEVVAELEYDLEVYGMEDSPYELEYIIEWSDGVAYLTPMDRRGYRIQTGDLPDRVKWEE